MQRPNTPRASSRPLTRFLLPAGIVLGAIILAILLFVLIARLTAHTICPGGIVAGSWDNFGLIPNAPEGGFICEYDGKLYRLGLDATPTPKHAD